MKVIEKSIKKEDRKDQKAKGLESPSKKSVEISI